MSGRLARSQPKRSTSKSKGTTVNYDEDFVLDEIPQAWQITAEICGEPDSGKTHFARTFPKPLFLDTEAKAWIVLQKFNDTPLKVVEKFNDIRSGVHWALDNPDIQTIVIDSGSDLRDLAQAEWLAEQGKDRVYPLVLWGEVYEKVDTLTTEIKKSQKHFVTTARMKDEFVGDQRTGRRIRDSYKKFPWDLSIGLEVVNGIRDTRSGKIHFPERRFGKVYKNNFYGIDQGKMVTQQKPYIFDVSYNGILNEMLQPWGGDDGIPIGNEIDTILEEAEEWIIKYG
jgi:hypothetical protein